MTDSLNILEKSDSSMSSDTFNLLIEDLSDSIEVYEDYMPADSFPIASMMSC